MSFRNRTTRFSSSRPKDSISVIAQVSAPTVARRTQVTAPRPTRFTPRPRVTSTRVSRPPTRIVTTTRVSRPPTRVTRVSRPTRVTTTRVRPPPRDDFQRSLSVFPEAFAEEAPRQVIVPQAQAVPVKATVQRRSGRGARARTPSPSIVPARTVAKDRTISVSLEFCRTGPIISTP